MKRLSTYYLPICVALAVCVGVLVFVPALSAQPMNQHGQAPLGTLIAQQATRACAYPAGGWTIVNCSAAAAAQSGQLVSWARYVVQCGSDSYFAMGDAATDEADSSDGWIPSGAWMDLMTTDSVRYFSCLNKADDTDCRYIRCM